MMRKIQTPEARLPGFKSQLGRSLNLKGRLSDHPSPKDIHVLIPGTCDDITFTAQGILQMWLT